MDAYPTTGMRSSASRNESAIVEIWKQRVKSKTTNESNFKLQRKKRSRYFSMLDRPKHDCTTRTCLHKHVHDALRACWYFEVSAIDLWACKRNDTILTRDWKYSLSPMRLNSWMQSSQAFWENADMKITHNTMLDKQSWLGWQGRLQDSRGKRGKTAFHNSCTCKLTSKPI